MLAFLVFDDVHALEHFDFEQKYFIEPGEIIKDHSLIRVDSTFHLFYLRGNPAVNIGHATSTDLVHWKIEDPVLSVQSSDWDNLAMWAPQVLDVGGTYFMFYTGVNTFWSQQTGLGFSNDLYAWNKLPWPLYHPDPSWAEWSDSTWSHGRDPFVFSYNGLYYMLVTAKTNDNRGAIASAVSDNMFTWQDNGPIYIHDSWHVLESVQMIMRNDKFHLFFTEEVVNGTSHMASDSLYSGWDINTRTILDDGHAPEINLFDGSYIFSRHTIYNDNYGGSFYTIVFDTLKWSGDLPYVHKPWPLWGDWNLIWGNAFIAQPTFGDNPHARGDTVDVNFEGNCWIGTYERYQGPLKYGTPGGYQGESAKGVIRSRTFTITGNSINLLVGGGDYPDQCYVALVDASNGNILFKETGKNTDRMDRRYWDVSDLKGKQVYIEIADLSSSYFGHINCDDITESNEIITPGGGGGTGRQNKKDYLWTNPGGHGGAKRSPQLYQNYPNPFNPSTTISYYLPEDADVTLAVFDVKGRAVTVLVRGRDTAGEHSVTWNGLNDNGQRVSSGIFLYRLTVNGKPAATRKMILIE